MALGSSAGAYTIWVPSKWEQDEAEQGCDVKPTYKVKSIKEILEILG
ncbi:MAG: hypothetical protein NZ903_02000 [Candidatus Micrarchaeota archaeon]|nr:hypothetical protein [Candidatus Micrarchaeota archaeon]